MDDLLYWVALHGVEGLGPAAFRLILDKFPGPKAAMEAPRRELISIRGLNGSVIKGIAQGRERLEDTKRLLKILNKSGIKVIIQGEEGYPTPMEGMKNPPVILYVRGEYLQGGQGHSRPKTDLATPSLEGRGEGEGDSGKGHSHRSDEKAVAIVGTTRPSEKGFRIARESARRLVRMGYTIVSGYARGIDSAAHLGALEAGGRTILALPMGILGFSWRREFQPFIGRGTLSASGGCPTDNHLILSDCFPTKGWHVGAAMSRNRLIACLSRAVLVVETEDMGGAVYTAGFAMGLGRKVFTLRYKDTPLSARGNKPLMEKGAVPLTNFKELEECMTNLL